MFPSFHEFKSEPIAPLQYDPYFPSAGACTGGSGSSGPSPVTSINSEVGTDLYNTYQNNGGGYSQYPTPQSWSGSSTGSQPSPSPHNYYTDTGPGPPLNGGPVDPAQSYYNNQQNYSGQQAAAAQASSNPNQGQQMSYYSQQQPCNQYTADQYNYTNYNGAPPWHPPPGSSPPPLYQQYGQIKNEYIEMKTPQQVQQSHPGAIPPNSYYGGGNGHVSPHHISPHLMHPGMPGPQGPPPPPMMQHDSWGGPKMQQLGGQSPSHLQQPQTVSNGCKRPNSKEFHGQTKITDEFKATKKPRGSGSTAKRATNRFNGMSEEEVAKRGLPDYLKPGLDIVFIGINPSMFAAYTGKYYDGPGNHFWQALYLSGILSEPMSAVDDHKLLDLGIGFTNIVPRTTRGLSDLSRKEIADGAEVLREKLCKFKPKVAVFNGKAIYEVYSGQKKFMFGRQPTPLSDGATWLWVMPSSSARCAQLPRAVDKVPFFEALRKFRDYLTGRLHKIEDCEVVFANVSLRNWTANHAAIKSDGEVDEVNPNLQPFTDGVPANVPESVTSVIEDVVRRYGDGTPEVATTAMASMARTAASATPLQCHGAPPATQAPASTNAAPEEVVKTEAPSELT